MTIEKLIGLSADEWDRLTPLELEQILAPYKSACRPSDNSTRTTGTIPKDMDLVMSLARQHGFADVLSQALKAK